MTNQAANKFVKQLIAAFSRFPTSKETVQLYCDKLGKWRLTQDEWDKAFDLIIESQNNDNLPSLATIYEYLKHAQVAHSETTSDDLGWIYSNHKGSTKAIRVKNMQGVWVIVDLIYRDSHGKETHLQNHSGEDVGKWIPKDAENVICKPDKEANPKAEDMPTDT
jgi:hypothetical protein